MTDGPQQHEEHPDADNEFAPKPGQPTMPFRAITPPAGGQQENPGYGYPQQGGPAQQLPHPGYGYPPQDPSAAPQPQQSGYGFPQQPVGEQHAAAWTPPSAPIGTSRPGGEPDWSALADRSAQEGAKRRRLLLIGGGALAVVLIGAIVTTAVVVTGHKKPIATPTVAPTDTGVPEPSPSFSDVSPTPPPNPLKVISNAKTDTAPITAAGLFPGARINFPGRTYAKTALSSTTDCAGAAGGSLPPVLAQYDCHRMVRATYTRDGIAVTVGIAVFDTSAEAAHVKAAAGPYVLPLAGGGIGHAFCHATACQARVNAIGRYAYFTIAGRVDGTAVTATDPATQTAAANMSTFAFDQLIARGRQPAAGH